MELLKLTGIAIVVSCFVGTSLGFLVKLIVEQNASTGDYQLADAISRGLDDIRRQKVITLDDFPREALSRKNPRLA
jgi:hypothetical protein